MRKVGAYLARPLPGRGRLEDSDPRLGQRTSTGVAYKYGRGDSRRYICATRVAGGQATDLGP